MWNISLLRDHALMVVFFQHASARSVDSLGLEEDSAVKPPSSEWRSQNQSRVKPAAQATLFQTSSSYQLKSGFLFSKCYAQFCHFYPKTAHTWYLEQIWRSANPINHLLTLTGRTSAKRIQKLSFRPCHIHLVTVLTESSDHFLQTSIETPEVCGTQVLSQQLVELA